MNLVHKKKHKIKYDHFNQCNICKAKKLYHAFSLGKHTPADMFVKKKYLNQLVPEVKLKCVFCKFCYNLQLTKTLLQSYKYNNVTYSYSSSNSKKSKSYLNEYYDYVIKNTKIKNGKILEIGANDGFLIKKFRSKLFSLYACEISKYWSKKLKLNKIRTENEVFEKISDRFLKKNKGSFQIIIANNVVNHTHNINKFFKNIYKLLDDKGFFIMEVPYLPWMIDKKKFELIYLEHTNYLMVTSVKKICDLNNLFINKIFFPNYHGKMLRLIISKKKNNVSLNKIIKNERKDYIGFQKLKLFKKNIFKRKKKFVEKLKNIKKNKNNHIVAIGASAKTNSLLNFFNLNSRVIDFVTDNSRQKVGKYIVNKKIPIKQDRDLRNIENIYVFFSTWNISNFVKKKIIKINKNINYIKY